MAKKNTYHHGDLKNALIKAGIEILAKNGIGGLSLRKVAQKAEVSHTAPYAHFADKQALIAAISTEGYRQLYEQVIIVTKRYENDPIRQMLETAWTYVQFAMNDPDQFKIMFSSVLEKEKEYPDYVEMSQKTFQQVVAVVVNCQEVGVLQDGPGELTAVSIWSAVHGLIALLLEGQIPHSVLAQFSVRQMLIFTLNQLCRPGFSFGELSSL
ncbi:MAG: TetR/AcrR family transcriptional regulator [Chloroflexi bacterium]|nr:MAG: TetR/AcrR family transcriptional regulator [Chloroflexota bacterium]